MWFRPPSLRKPAIVPADRFKGPYGGVAAAIAAALLIAYGVSVYPYVAVSPYVEGRWSVTLTDMPDGITRPARALVQLNIEGTDPSGAFSGTISVLDISGPVIGRVYGRHISIASVPSMDPGDNYSVVSFEGVVREQGIVRDQRIEGTLVDSIAGEPKPRTFEISLQRSMQ